MSTSGHAFRSLLSTSTSRAVEKIRYQMSKTESADEEMLRRHSPHTSCMAGTILHSVNLVLSVSKERFQKGV